MFFDIVACLKELTRFAAFFDVFGSLETAKRACQYFDYNRHTPPWPPSGLRHKREQPAILLHPTIPNVYTPEN